MSNNKLTDIEVYGIVNHEFHIYIHSLDGAGPKQPTTLFDYPGGISFKFMPDGKIYEFRCGRCQGATVVDVASDWYSKYLELYRDQKQELTEDAIRTAVQKDIGTVIAKIKADLTKPQSDLELPEADRKRCFFGDV
ncbi:MAG: hypothetical protein ABH849_03440 [Nanoarchaeota archaeon]|nr:hypothetical protein [Nanoarchaeota archaeon]